MKNLPRITEIIKIEPFKITARWNTGEILVMDFENWFAKWEAEKNANLLKINDFENFKYASVSESGTLQWVNIPIQFQGLNQQILTAPLDIDPDVLYQNSQPIEKYRLVLAEI
jgi:hypothetical protein